MTGDNDTITLKDAAQHFGYTVWTLRAEAERGHLTIYKIGKRYYTTPADIREMVAKCRVEQKGHGFTLIRNESNGLSVTERALSAQARAQETVMRLKNTSPNISGKSTNQSRRARQ